jgi:hypothetical protein
MKNFVFRVPGGFAAAASKSKSLFASFSSEKEVLAYFPSSPFSLARRIARWHLPVLYAH